CAPTAANRSRGGRCPWRGGTSTCRTQQTALATCPACPAASTTGQTARYAATRCAAGYGRGRRRAYGDRMTAEPQWAVVQWDDGTLSLTDISLLDKADDSDSDGQAGEQMGE